MVIWRYVTPEAKTESWQHWTNWEIHGGCFSSGSHATLQHNWKDNVTLGVCWQIAYPYKVFWACMKIHWRKEGLGSGTSRMHSICVQSNFLTSVYIKILPACCLTYFHQPWLSFMKGFRLIFFFHLIPELLVENTCNLVNTKHSKFILGFQTWVWGLTWGDTLNSM